MIHRIAQLILPTALFVASSGLLLAQEDSDVDPELEALSSNVFTFGQYSFDQRNTPDYFEYIPADQVVGGARFDNEAIPVESNSGVLFPDSQEGFNFLLCVGNRIAYGEGIARALNMPAENIGINKRTGIQLGWSGGRVLPNNGGIDLVFFESGDVPGEPDAFMVRALNANTGEWTRWRYQAAAGYKVTVSRRPVVVFATELDLTDIGIPPGDAISSIQIANMTAFDRIAGVGEYAEGFVVFDKASSELPKPNPRNEFIKSHLERALYDPDILYVAAIQNVRSESSAGSGDNLDDFFR